GIEVKHPVFDFLLRYVAVAADDRGESGRLGFEIEVLQNMQDVNGEADFKHIGHGNGFRPGAAVHVAANGSDWSDLAQCVENFWVTYVAGMDDAIGSAQRVESFGAKQA